MKGDGEKEFKPGMVVKTTTGRVIFNDILLPKMPYYNLSLGQKQLQGIIADCYQLLGRRETINLLDAMKDLGFRESTRSGLSFATDDLLGLLQEHKVTIDALNPNPPTPLWQTLLLSFGQVLLLVLLFVYVSRRMASLRLGP